MTNTKPSGAFDELLNEAWERGICSGEVVYSQSTSEYDMDGHIPFEARYLPCLDEKPTSRSPSPDRKEDKNKTEEKEGSTESEQPPPRDPFAEPRDNIVESMDNYTCVLNKYALEKNHFLIVTNDFYPQMGRLRTSDLLMIYKTLSRVSSYRPYCFFNAGQLAGASQQHRHFQFCRIPDFAEQDQQCWPEQIYNAIQEPKKGGHSHPDIPAHHFLLPIKATDDESELGNALTQSFEELYDAARAAIPEAALRKQEEAQDEPEMQYNFMMTREYMLILPRRNEEWDRHEIGVGGTCLTGSIMVAKTKDLAIAKKVGIKEILKYVGFPK